MIVCSNCGNQEMPGALYCSECGTQFQPENRDLTITIPASISDHLRNRSQQATDQAVPPTPEDAHLSLFLVDLGQVIPLEGLSEYTIGRSAEDQPLLPDIDLSP
jgi:hypothetical protein